MKTEDTHYMELALALAKKGVGKTRPGPLVGAVIVKQGQIIGKGYYKKFGSAHAEIEAINSATANLKDSTLYVTLEPHGYSGKTPPCTQAIIKAGIRRVVCAMLDPNPEVNGDGVKQLKKAGTRITIGVLKQEAYILNEQFITFHIKKRPFIAIKFASSLDGRLATTTGDSKWITNEAARTYGRTLRGHYQAILVGANTVTMDNPHLGTRQKNSPDPLRIILTSHSQLPKGSQVLRDTNVMLFNGPLQELMNKLYKMNIVSVLVEGGATVINTFVDQGLVDRVYGFYAPIIIGKARKIETALQLSSPQVTRFDNNFLVDSSVVSTPPRDAGV